MSIAHANRGMGFESLIEYANNQYEARGVAQIQKVSTPWKVIRKAKQIVSAFPERKSTVDFIGVYKGKAVAFDAKSTQLKTRFPLANVENHQLEFMQGWQRQAGITFFLIEFSAFNEVYFVTLDEMTEHIRSQRESIPYKYFQLYGKKVEQSGMVVLDYLKHAVVTP